MAQPTPQTDLEALILEALYDQLETALDLAVHAQAPNDLDQIADVCQQTAELARSGRLLLTCLTSRRAIRD